MSRSRVRRNARRLERELAPPGPLQTRTIELEDVPLSVRTGPDGARIIEGRIVPFGLVATVQDRDAATGRPVGRPYREVIEGLDNIDPAGILLEAGHRGAIAGRSISVEARQDGGHAAFRMLGTSAGLDQYELAREGIVSNLSIEIDPKSPSRTRPDGVVARRAIVRRVAIVEKGAYEGAAITAVRAREVEPVFRETPSTAAATAAAAPAAPVTAATEPANAGTPPQFLTRSEVEAMIASQMGASQAGAQAPAAIELQRAAAERGTVAQLGRSPIRVTREAAIYGPGSEHSFFGDGWRVAQRSHGWEEAGDRLERHYAFLEDVDLAIQRAVGFGNDPVMARAGDVLSSEIPGAYPSEYMPGLIVNRLLKQRPLASFYERFPLTDGRPRIYPVVSTSTSVAVQSAEGANPAASDFATTATTITPLFYGGETKVSRQVLDGADPTTDAMLSTDLTEAYMQASETVVKTAVEAGSTASGVTLTAATPNIGLINLVLNHFQNVFLPANVLFLPTTLYGSWITQLDTTNRPLTPYYGPVNADAVLTEAGFAGAVLSGVPTRMSWASTPGSGAGVGGVAVVARASDFAIFESNIVRFQYDQGAEAPAAVRIGLWAYLVVGVRRGSRKATGA